MLLNTDFWVVVAAAAAADAIEPDVEMASDKTSCAAEPSDGIEPSADAVLGIVVVVVAVAAGVVAWVVVVVVATVCRRQISRTIEFRNFYGNSKVLHSLAAVLNEEITASVEVAMDFLSFCISVVVSMALSVVGCNVVGAVVDSAKYDAERNAFEAPRAVALTNLEKTFSASRLLLRMCKSSGSHSGCGPEWVPSTVPACFRVCERMESVSRPSSKFDGRPW